MSLKNTVITIYQRMKTNKYMSTFDIFPSKGTNIPYETIYHMCSNDYYISIYIYPMSSYIYYYVFYYIYVVIFVCI